MSHDKWVRQNLSYTFIWHLYTYITKSGYSFAALQIYFFYCYDFYDHHHHHDVFVLIIFLYVETEACHEKCFVKTCLGAETSMCINALS